MKALAVASGIVFWSLVLGIAWYALFSGSDQQEPVAVLQVEPAPAPAPEAAPAPAAPGGIDFPPGFSITGPDASQQVPAAPSVPVPGTTLAPSPDEIGVPDLPETPGDSAEPQPGEPLDVPPPEVEAPPAAEAPPTTGMQPPLEAPPTADMAPDPGEPPTGDAPPLPDRRSEALGIESAAATPSETATVPATLAGTFDSDLVEESDYGPLPKIAVDGRRPAEVYAHRSPRESPAGPGSARVAILISGLGLPDAPSGDVLKGLPAAISVAYGAYSRDLQDLVAKARAAGHEVLLQIPLEPEDYPNEDPGPHTLLTTLPSSENLKRLHWLMSRYAGYVGVTNHMGAKFKANRESLAPVLEELKKRGLIYLDDGTVQDSAVERVANSIGLDHADVDVQIDATPSIAKALAELESEARSRGTAIGVARAKPEIVKLIADWAGKLEAKGIVLVPVSAAVLSQRQI